MCGKAADYKVDLLAVGGSSPERHIFFCTFLKSAIQVSNPGYRDQINKKVHSAPARNPSARNPEGVRYGADYPSVAQST